MAKKSGKKEEAAVEGQQVEGGAPAVAAAAPEAAAKPVKAPKPPKEPKPVVVKDTKNGMTRPNPNSMIFKIWACADEVALEVGPALVKKPLVKAKLEAYGETIKDSTIQAQFNYWRKYMGLVVPRAAKEAPPAAAVEGEATATEGEAAAA